MFGNLKKIDLFTRSKLKSVEKITLNNTGLQLNLAISYGGRQEILEAINKIIVNDGAILSFKSMGMKTYKSDFSYVSWSAKKMNTEYKDYQQIGLFDEGNVNRLVVSKVGDRMYNLNFRGVFIPGIRQVHFVDEFLKYKFD